MTEQLAPESEATLVKPSADATGRSRDLSTFLPLSSLTIPSFALSLIFSLSGGEADSS